MIKLILGVSLLVLSSLGIWCAFRESDKSKAKIKLDEELSRSEILSVKSEYLDAKKINDKLNENLNKKEQKLEK